MSQDSRLDAALARGDQVVEHATRRASRAWSFAIGQLTPTNAITAGLFFATVVGLYAYQTEALDESKALALITFPPLAAVAILRPAWVLLALLAAPPDLLSTVTPRLLLIGILGAMGAMVARTNKIHFGWSTGIYPLVGILLFASVRPSDVTGAGADVADGILKLMQYYVVLMLFAYNAVRMRVVTIRALATALLVGGVVTAVLSTFGGPFAGEVTSNRVAAYPIAMGMLVAFGRLVLGRRDHIEGQPLVMNAVLVAALGFVLAEQLVRATWLSILLAFVLMAMWTAKARWLVAIPLVATLILGVPSARDRVVPSGPVDLSVYTSGRWTLWEPLIEETVEGLPLGNGWGHWFSLTPEELFGFQSFVDEGNDTTYVYAHDDWLYLSVDLGVVGPIALTMLWIQLALAFRRLGRRPGPTRDAAVVLVGTATTYLFVQLFDNGFAIQPVAERFFIVAGGVFGLHAVMTRELGLVDDANVAP